MTKFNPWGLSSHGQKERMYRNDACSGKVQRSVGNCSTRTAIHRTVTRLLVSEFDQSHQTPRLIRPAKVQTDNWSESRDRLMLGSPASASSRVLESSAMITVVASLGLIVTSALLVYLTWLSSRLRGLSNQPETVQLTDDYLAGVSYENVDMLKAIPEATHAGYAIIGGSGFLGT